VIGVSEVLAHERTGLLVPEGDVTAMADALQRVLNDTGLGERLAAAARTQAIAEHGQDLMRRRYARLLRDLVDQSDT